MTKVYRGNTKQWIRYWHHMTGTPRKHWFRDEKTMLSGAGSWAVQFILIQSNLKANYFSSFSPIAFQLFCQWFGCCELKLWMMKATDPPHPLHYSCRTAFTLSVSVTAAIWGGSFQAGPARRPSSLRSKPLQAAVVQIGPRSGFTLFH